METPLRQIIGVDLGGSAIKLGRFTPEGHCTASLTVATPEPSTPIAVIEAMANAVTRLDPDRQGGAIGVGTPGPADVTGRVARVAINLAGWQDVPLAQALEDRTQRPTVIANDANCAGLGEFWLGAGQRYQDMILLTLGTGVGGAVILGGHLFTGRRGTAGELGLITLNFDGPPCNSGNSGSLEQYCSIRGIRRETGLEPQVLAAKAEAGDADAIAFWQQYGRRLGAGLASLIYVLTPEAVILGGGISAGAALFIPALKQEITERVLPTSRPDLEILIAQLGNQAGVVGAAKLALQTFSEG